MEVLEIFKGMNNLLSDESKWTKEYFAWDSDGDMCDPRSEEAVCWCLLGALHIVDPTFSNYRSVHEYLSSKIGKGVDGNDNIVEFNDSHTFLEVKALLTSIIEELEKENSHE